MILTDQEIIDISGRHGTMNDFGKTFFTDGELVEFVNDCFQAGMKVKMQERKDQMRQATEERGVEW